MILALMYTSSKSLSRVPNLSYALRILRTHGMPAVALQKSPGPPPCLGCCTQPLHGGALCMPPIDSASSISCSGLLGWGISHLGNLMRRLWLQTLKTDF